MLDGAQFGSSTLMDADFSGAVITNASFSAAPNGLTEQQLYSTASYKGKDLRGVSLYSVNAAGWDFSGQDLTRARFENVDLTGTNFAGSNLTR